MKKTVRPSFVPVLLIVLVSAMALVGCGDSPPPAAQSTATPDALGGLQDARPTADSDAAGVLVPPTGIEIAEVAETGNYRDAIVKGLGKITWVDPGQGETLTDTGGAQEIARVAIRSEGERLAAVNYVNLSLADFREVTGQLQLSGSDFQTGDVVLEAIGRENDAHRYLLFSYTGKEIPKHPERPLVSRWVQTYALFDNTTGTVARLVATIRGEVHE